MSITILSEKKYCPMCYWTLKTDRTHCPQVGDYPKVHDYNISVPLEICKPDTSSQHKEIRSRHQSPAIPDQKRVAKLYRRSIPPDVLRSSINLDGIKRMQKEKGRNLS